MLAVISLIMAAGSFIAFPGVLRKRTEDQVRYQPYQNYAKNKDHP
jgi:hypothetical protein